MFVPEKETNKICKKKKKKKKKTQKTRRTYRRGITKWGYEILDLGHFGPSQLGQMFKSF